MHIPRFLIESAQITSDATAVTLSREQTHHLFRVLRRREGSLLEVLTRDNPRLFQARVSELRSKEAFCEILEALVTVPVNPAITLLLGQPKNRCLEQVIQQATEIGIASVLCFPAEHSAVKAEINLRRLASIRDNAVEQARLSHLPELAYFPSPEVLLSSRIPSDSLKILCSSPAEALLRGSQPATIVDVLRESTKNPANSHSLLEKPSRNVEIYIAVGPEGGFSSAEIDLFIDNQFQQATLGPYVARVETAVIVAAGISRLTAGA